MPGDLIRDTAVHPLPAAPGWYTANLPPAWDFRTPSGGVLMTIAMRAMQAEVADPALRPVSANTHFCSPVPSGPLEIRVELLRHGGAAAQVRAQLTSTLQPGPGLEVSATFGRDRDGIDLIDTEPPVPLEPEALTPVEDLPGIHATERPPFFENFDTRLAMGPVWWERGWEPGPARIARWFRYKVPPRLGDGRFDPLAIPPIADTMPPVLIRKLGPDRTPFFAPSLDLTVHFLEDTDSQWILTHVHAPRARGGFATASTELWDDAGRLIAMATQMMILRQAPPGFSPKS